MSEPIHLFNNPIITNGDMSTTLNSTPSKLNGAASFNIQAIFTGTPVGTFQIRGSNDVPLNADIPDPDSFTTITDSIQVINGAGSYMINVEIPSYAWVLLQYIPTSGSGTVNARINAKRK